MSDGGIRVNMSAKEGASVTLEPLPSGKYLMAITDCEVEKVKNAPAPGKKDNRGKLMFKIELTVQDGDYENRKAWTNVMLFDGALYSLSQMVKALGYEVVEKGESAEFQIPGFAANIVPGAEWWMGKQFVVRTQLMPKRKDKTTGKEYQERTEVKGFMSAKGWNAAQAPKKSAEGAASPAKKTSALP